MDLNRLSREELEREAARLGVSEPHALGRAELIRAVRRCSGEPGTLRRAVSLLGRAVNRARSAVEERLEQARMPRLSSSERRAPSGAAPADHPSPRPETDAPAGPRTRRGDGSAPAGDAEEPIATRTMARILRDQGHERRALAIYTRLLQDHPDDPELQREADEARARAGRSHGRHDARATHQLADDDDPDDEDEVVAVPVDAARLLVSWSVHDHSLAHARRVHAANGPLTLRLVIVAPDPTRVIRTETREWTDVARRGERVVDALPAGARVTASLGLAARDGFRSVAHAPSSRVG